MNVGIFGSNSVNLLVIFSLAVAGGTGAQAQVGSAPQQAASDSTTPEAWFNSMDTDRNKQLSLDEFRSGLVARNQAIVFQRLQAQFKAVDKNKSGFLEASEFYVLPVIKNAGSGAPTLDSVDSSKDAKLDFKEYAGLIMKMAGSKR